MKPKNGGINLVIASIITLILLTGCTYARYTDAEKSLTVINLHPVGEAVSLSAELEGKGSMDLNRETESTLTGVAEVVDSAIDF